MPVWDSQDPVSKEDGDKILQELIKIYWGKREGQRERVSLPGEEHGWERNSFLCFSFLQLVVMQDPEDGIQAVDPGASGRGKGRVTSSSLHPDQ